MSSRRRLAMIVAVLAPLGGCYESSIPLSSPEGSVTNPKLFGTWTCRDAGDETSVATLLVLPFDSARYYVEWRQDDETSRYAAHSSNVGEGAVENVREIGVEGSETTWIFMRATVTDDARLVLDVVEDDDLRGFEEARALREIRRRVKDETLYSGFAVCARP